jgi:hypothetical protein
MTRRLDLCRIWLVLIPLMYVGGCAKIMEPMLNATSPPGQLTADGKITPCHGYRANHQLCGNAIFNGARIRKVNIGQSIDEVRQVMERDPEERNVRSDGGRAIETWIYFTHYETSQKTYIQFIDGKVTALEQKR